MKLLQGTFRADRHGEELQIEAKWPDPPAHLSERELELWKQLKAHCAGWVAPSDFLAVNGVVSLMDRLLTIQEAMRKEDGAGNPITFKFTPSADGEPNMEAKDNPLYGMELKFWTALRGYIGIVGLSPVDRARVQKGGEDDKPKSALDRFLTKAKA